MYSVAGNRANSRHLIQLGLSVELPQLSYIYVLQTPTHGVLEQNSQHMVSCLSVHICRILILPAVGL